MDQSLYDYCEAQDQQVLIEQWDQARNAPVTPQNVSRGSNRKVWWRCEKGHAWQASIKSRASGSGCPICANRTLSPGENDLAATCPELAQQWHPSKNGALTAAMVFPGSRRRVWWQCEKGHEWQATVVSRTNTAAGCPVCAGKTILPGENDLASAFPSIAAQWHPGKNGTLTPQTVSAYSNRRVWWQCELGHVWKTTVGHRTMTNSGCPYCTGRKAMSGFNDLATVLPEIAAQWHPTLNESLTPDAVTVGSHKRVWWQCSEGHVWQAVVYSRTGPRKCGCPVCARKVKLGTPAKPIGFVGERTQQSHGMSRV